MKPPEFDQRHQNEPCFQHFRDLRRGSRLPETISRSIRFRLLFHECHKRPEKGSGSSLEELSNPHGLTDELETEQRFWRVMLASESRFTSENRMIRFGSEFASETRKKWITQL